MDLVPKRARSMPLKSNHTDLGTVASTEAGRSHVYPKQSSSGDASHPRTVCGKRGKDGEGVGRTECY